MQLSDYRAFTETLTRTLAADLRVLGLIALGSMAEQDYPPDRWSDHDFFVVTVPGEQAAFSTDLSWLPDAEQIAFSFHDSGHGVRAVYRNGHLVELVVFDEKELLMAKVNRYRVLLDRSQIASQVASMVARTAMETSINQASDESLLGEFLTNLMVGAARYWRGERLSGHIFVKSYATEQLVQLLARHVPAERHGLLDNLAPTRRFDLVYPELAARLDVAANLPAPEAALQLLGLAEEALRLRLPAFPIDHVAVAKQYLSNGGEQYEEA